MSRENGAIYQQHEQRESTNRKSIVLTTLGTVLVTYVGPTHQKLKFLVVKV